MKSPEMGQEAKKWPQLLAALSANIVVFATACHSGWPAPSVPRLLSDDFPFEVTSEEASYIVIISPLGNICGVLIGTTLLDRLGRKRTIMLIVLPQVISFSLILVSYQVLEVLYLARYIGGIAEGMTYAIVPLYIAEIAEPLIRGTLGSLVIIFSLFGMVYVNLVGSYLSIKTTALTFFAFPLLFLLLFWRMPDSPYYLLMKNKQEEARKALEFLRRRDASDELATLTKDVCRQMSESGSFKDIFTIDSNRKAFILTVGARIIQQLTGISAFALYIQVLLKSATDSLEPHIGATILLLVQLFMSVFSTFLVDKYGRKPLLLFSTGSCCLNLLIQGVYFILKEHTDVDVSIVDWFPLVMMILYVILFFSGLGIVVNILSSEMFPAKVKGKSLCLVNITFALGIMGTTKFYQVTSDNFGLTVPYFSFGFCTLFGFVFLYFCVPETKGKSLEEIQQQLKGNKRVNGVEKI